MSEHLFAIVTYKRRNDSQKCQALIYNECWRQGAAIAMAASVTSGMSASRTATRMVEII